MTLIGVDTDATRCKQYRRGGIDNMSTDDGSFFPQQGDDFDRYIDVISVASRRVSLAVLSAGFAYAGASMVGAETTSLYGRVSLGLAVLFGVWTAATNRT